MTDSIIYLIEARLPGEKRVGVFMERRTAQAWMNSLGNDVDNTTTPVHLMDSRYNHNLNGAFNSTLFKVCW